MKYATDKCIAWNELRYEQEYDYNLAVKLLLEETNELFASDTIVDVLDAVGDITFVAVGVMWKLGMTNGTIKSYFYDNDLTKVSIEECHNLCCLINNQHMEAMENYEGGFPGLHLACYSVFITAISALRGIGMQASFYDIFDAICVSNDTKEVKGKTLSSIKANISKGKGFIPPTAKLQQIRDLYNVPVGAVRQ